MIHIYNIKVFPQRDNYCTLVYCEKTLFFLFSFKTAYFSCLKYISNDKIHLFDSGSNIKNLMKRRKTVLYISAHIHVQPV